MGFRVNWVYADDLAGISKDAARIFLRLRTGQEESQDYNVLVWLNLDSPLEVEPREFMAQDLDGNRFRVFNDLGVAK